MRCNLEYLDHRRLESDDSVLGKIPKMFLERFQVNVVEVWQERLTRALSPEAMLFLGAQERSRPRHGRDRIHELLIWRIRPAPSQNMDSPPIPTRLDAGWCGTLHYARMTRCTPNYDINRLRTLQNQIVLHLVLHASFGCR
jgi:hypothetical protein